MRAYILSPCNRGAYYSAAAHWDVLQRTLKLMTKIANILLEIAKQKERRIKLTFSAIDEWYTVRNIYAEAV